MGIGRMSPYEKSMDLKTLLQSQKQWVTRRWLEKRWNCTAVTVHRIVSRLKQEGVPIHTSDGRYRLEEGRSLELPGFWLTPDELAALLGLSNWLETLGSGVLKDRLLPIHYRLEEMLKRKGLQPSEWRERIRLLPMQFRPVDADILLDASCATLNRKRVEFDYRGVRDADFRPRKASPQSLVRYRDNWYMDAWDHGRSELRSFALSRMRALQVQAEPAREIPGPDLDAHFAESYGIIAGRARRTAKLVFSGEAARFIGEERWHPKQKASCLDGGRLRLELPCGDIRELARDLMRYADEVSVVGPKELRQAVQSRVRKAAESGP